MIHPIALSLFAFAGGSSHDAEPLFSYTYADLSYVYSDVDVANDELTGFDALGSAEISDHMRVFAGYSAVTLGNFDTNTMQAGIGYHNPVFETSEVILDAGYVRADADGAASAVNGYLLGLEYRFMVYDRFEFDAGATYREFEGGADNTAVEAGFLYYLNDSIGLSLSADFDDDNEVFFAGIRYQAAPGTRLF